MHAVRNIKKMRLCFFLGVFYYDFSHAIVRQCYYYVIVSTMRLLIIIENNNMPKRMPFDSRNLNDTTVSEHLAENISQPHVTVYY